MAQREPRTPLCRFRLLSLPYRQKTEGNVLLARGAANQRFM